MSLAGDNQDEEVVNEISVNQCNLDGENEAICQLEALYNEVTKYWFDIKLHRDIGHVQHAEAIKVNVEGGTQYTLDWGMFLATEVKVKDCFKGNVIDLSASHPLSYLPCLMKTTLFKIKIFPWRSYGIVLSWGWWCNQVKVSCEEKA